MILTANHNIDYGGSSGNGEGRVVRSRESRQLKGILNGCTLQLLMICHYEEGVPHCTGMSSAALCAGCIHSYSLLLAGMLNLQQDNWRIWRGNGEGVV